MVFDPDVVEITPEAWMRSFVPIWKKFGWKVTTAFGTSSVSDAAVTAAAVAGML